MQLIDEIIEMAVDDKRSSSVLLRKCLVLAHQLKNQKLRIWVEQELNGYTERETVPDYRHSYVHAKGSFYGPAGNVLNGQPLPSAILEKEHRNWGEEVWLMQPVVAYESTEESGQHGGTIQWPANMIAYYQNKFFPGWTLVRAYQEIPRSVFLSLTDTVRNRVLQLGLDLRDELGEVRGDPAQLPASKVNQSIVTNIYGGNVVIASSAENFAQVNNISVIEDDIESLRAALHEIGLRSKDVTGLIEAIDADRAGGQTPTFGGRTKAWLREMPGKAAAGGLRASVEVAKAVVTKAILQYMGIP